MHTIYTGILIAAMFMYSALFAGAESEEVLEQYFVEQVFQQETPEVPADEIGMYYDETVRVSLLDNGTVFELNLQEYLVDVVLQEMPASFEEEALKAQAVAARTFTMRNMYSGGAHETADICGDSTCCQCYLSREEGIHVYGEQYESAREKVLTAVQATDGQVLMYEDELIEAVYFSSTGGSTESAAAVWGGEVPYLQPVSSPEDLRVSESTISFEEFRRLLPEASLSGNPASWFGGTTYTDGGSVDEMIIGGRTYTGNTLRKRFGLKASRFSLAITEAGISFEVVGSGHGVGMSQYGANTMAASGNSYREILLHYYSGAELKELY